MIPGQIILSKVKSIILFKIKPSVLTSIENIVLFSDKVIAILSSYRKNLTIGYIIDAPFESKVEGFGGVRKNEL